ncbi:MAG: hypothetical protein PHS14_11325 [Elusimicrobia bacterium]|nr:hypothetical protein [Elusimicrobiota bacterium]
MSDEPQHRTSRAGVVLVLLAVGGSAVGVVGWHLLSNRNAGLDTSGFDMSTTPDPANSAAPPSFPASAPSAPAPAQQTSLGMVKADAGMSVVGPGASTPKASGSSGAGANPANPKEEAALTFKDAALKYEKLVGAFVRRMEAKHPSITKFGKDWAASPELRALRDQYWKEKDPLKFAYGLAKSNDFGKLVKKYGADPGIRDALVTGIKEAPPNLTAAVGGVLSNDNVAKSLVTTVIKAVGLPASLTGFLTGGDAKAPDQNQVMSDIMNSGEMKKAMQNQQSPVPLDQKDADKAKDAATNNGFTPLRGGR